MKKLLALVSAALLLTSCGTAAATDGNETAHPSNWLRNVNADGEFFTDYVETPDHAGNRLNFFDFASMTSAVVCPKPNCKHDDPETCSAFGMRNHPTIIDGKLYFFTTETEWVSDTYVTNTRIYCAETDGTSRAEIGYLANLSVDRSSTMLIKGNTAYFIGTEGEFDNIKFAYTGFERSYMCSFNFKTRKFKNYGLVNEGYNSGVSLYGEYNGGIYMSSSYTKEKIDWFAEDAIDQMVASAILNYYRFDLETGEFEDSELPEATFIYGGYYGYNDGDNIVVLNSDGSAITFEGLNMVEKLSNIPINGFVFDTDGKFALDLNSGETKLLSSEIDDNDIITAYSDGGYIVKSQPDMTYRKISEADIFTDEISSEPEWLSFTDHPESVAFKNMTSEEQQEKIDADYERYYELLGIGEHVPDKMTGARVNSITYKFWQEYRCAVYDCASYYYLGAVVDTDYEAPCSIEITYVEVDPFTGEKREGSAFFENEDGECGIAAAVFPDEGFYFKEFNIIPHFSTVYYPLANETKDKEFYSDFGLPIPEANE